MKRCQPPNLGTFGRTETTRLALPRKIWEHGSCMKTTSELPDDLFVAAKKRAGLTVKHLL